MSVPQWSHRKARLLDKLRFSRDPGLGCRNFAVRITAVLHDVGECQIWDLGLADTFEGAKQFRKPQATTHFLRFRKPCTLQLCVNEDYVSVGAEIVRVCGPLPSLMKWPEITSTTGHVRLTASVPVIGEVAELFAGGINAWSRAVTQLPLSVTLKIDCKETAMQMMLINADDRDDPEPICSDVADMVALSKLCNEEAFLASPPCQPFSSMGKGLGLNAPSAVAWDRFFVTLRFAQRRYIVLENVCGLPKHEDFQEIVRAILYCGYTLVSRRVCDASSLGCTSRPRVMLVFWNNADWKESGQQRPHVPLVSAIGQPLSCSQAGSVWEDLPSHLASDLLLSQEDTDLLRKREFLPKCMQGIHKDPLSLRVINPCRPMPSVTAAYHRSANMPAEHVKAKGLHVPLVHGCVNGRCCIVWVLT